MIATWLTVEEAAELLRRGLSSLYADLQVGARPALRIHARLIRIPAARLPELAELVEPRPVPAAVTLRWLAEEWRCSRRRLTSLAQRGVLPLRQRPTDPTWACSAGEYRAWVDARLTGPRS